MCWLLKYVGSATDWELQHGDRERENSCTYIVHIILCAVYVICLSLSFSLCACAYVWVHSLYGRRHFNRSSLSELLKHTYTYNTDLQANPLLMYYNTPFIQLNHLMKRKKKSIYQITRIEFCTIMCHLTSIWIQLLGRSITIYIYIYIILCTQFKYECV